MLFQNRRTRRASIYRENTVEKIVESCVRGGRGGLDLEEKREIKNRNNVERTEMEKSVLVFR